MKKIRKAVKYTLLLVAIFVVSYVLFIGISAGFNWKKISVENPIGSAPFFKLGNNVQPGDLKSEGDGRINILLLGQGGAGHPGGDLTDTIQILSVDPQNQAVSMLSIPRDLQAKIPGYGLAKINSAYPKGLSKGKDGGSALAVQTVSNLLDLPIHYFVLIDFNGFKKLVDSLGGIDINVAKTLDDPLYPADNMIDYSPLYISQGQHHMSGALALKYARSRETTSDFDRSRRQQEVLLAMKDKAMSAGVLLNPAKISSLLSIAGNHVRTDLSLSNIQELAKIAKDTDSSKINSKVLDTSNILVSSSSEQGYYLVPKDNDYSLIREFAHQAFSDPYITKENASIIIKNGTGTSGNAEKLKQQLKEYGYNVINVEKAEKVAKTVIYDYSNGKKPFTVNFLSKRLEAKVTDKVGKGKSDIEIILGSDYKPNTEAKGSSPDVVSSNENNTLN